MIEHFSVPRCLGKEQLEHKIRAIEAEGLKVVKVVPEVYIRGGTEIGWDIQAENYVEPYRSVITGQMVYEM